MSGKVAHLADRAVLALHGSEVRGFLQDLLTNDIERLSPAAPLWAALLSAQGKPLADMVVFDSGDGGVWLDVAADAAVGLVRKFTMYTLRRDVKVAMTDLRVFAGWGAAQTASSDPRLAALGARWIGQDTEINAEPAAYDAHRLALGVPDSADLLIDGMMWLEANAAELNGVSFGKGCYVGQENTARMHHRDRLRKRLIPVSFSGDSGDGIIRSGVKEAGVLRTQRDGVGMAYLRLEFIERNAPLVMNGGVVTVRWPDYLPAL